MNLKTLILMGAAVGSIVLGWLGAALSHGNWFSLLSITGSIVGAAAGMWFGYKVKDYM